MESTSHAVMQRPAEVYDYQGCRTCCMPHADDNPGICVDCSRLIVRLIT